VATRQSIEGACVVVADLTGKNANIFYEVGIAHTLEKPVLLLAQPMSDVPFDLRHKRVLLYKYSLHWSQTAPFNDIQGQMVFRQHRAVWLKSSQETMFYLWPTTGCDPPRAVAGVQTEQRGKRS
jgi:hypothetical protein